MIITPNSKSLEEKINQLSEPLIIVSDYDGTLTNLYVDDRIISTFGLLRSYKGGEYSRKAMELYRTYSPLLANTDDRDRNKKLEEWWLSHAQLIAESKIHREDVFQLPNFYPDVFREGTLEFLHYLREREIPLVIFSAGISDVIRAYLTHNDIPTGDGKITIVANSFEYDKNGYVTGFQGKIIHSGNKSEEMLPVSLKNYKSILLLGDSPDDLTMVKNPSLSIGLLNKGIYPSGYDGLTDSMRDVIEILKS